MRKIDLIVVHRTEAGHTGAEVKINEPFAYHIFIQKDGTVEALYPLELQTNHACAFNSHSVAVALYGYFCPKPLTVSQSAHILNQNPTQAQLDSLVLICSGLIWWVGEPLTIKGHTELGPRGTNIPEKLLAATSCPGMYLDMYAVRTAVNNSNNQ